MKFKIVERYYPVTLTKVSQFCKAKDNRQHENKIDKFLPSLPLYLQSQQLKHSNKVLNMFKVNHKDTRTLLACRIFDSIRQHSILSAFRNMCFAKGRICCRKKVTKSKIGSKGFNLTKKLLNSTETSNQSSMFVCFARQFSCSDNITAGNSKIKCYKEL